MQWSATILGSRRSNHLISQTPEPLDQLPFHFVRRPAAKVLHPFLVIGFLRGHHRVKDDLDTCLLRMLAWAAKGARARFNPTSAPVPLQGMPTDSGDLFQTRKPLLNW